MAFTLFCVVYMGFLNATYLIQLKIDRNKRISQFENIFSLLPSLFDLDSWRQIMDTKTNEGKKKKKKLSYSKMVNKHMSNGGVRNLSLREPNNFFFSLYKLIIFILASSHAFHACLFFFFLDLVLSFFFHHNLKK